MRNLILIILVSVPLWSVSQDAISGTDDDLTVISGNEFTAIITNNEVPFDYVSGNTFEVFISNYNFRAGLINTSIEYVTPDLLDFKVYPNPFVSKVHLEAELQLNDPLTITLVNLSGQVLYREQINNVRNLDHSIDMSQQVLGQYFIILEQKGHVVGNAKLIKLE